MAEENRGAGAVLAPNGKMVEIRDVWMHNLDEEMTNVRKVSSLNIYNRCILYSTFPFRPAN